MVYKFYTAECPNEFNFKGHIAAIKKIVWFEDDTGFVTVGLDNFIMMYLLFPPQIKEQGTQIEDI
jgi:hypothetical protein